MKKDAGRYCSHGTGGRAVETLIAQDRIASFKRSETIETPTYKGTTEIVHIHIPEEHRRSPADIMLYLLPAPPEKKRHGGRKKIAVPPEVAAQGAAVRRTRHLTEKFYRLDADRNAPPLAVIAHPAVTDYCQADDTALTAAEAEAFQVEMGVQPPPPPRYRPVQRPFQVDGISIKGTSRQDDMASPAVIDLFHDETAAAPTSIHRNQGCRVPSCGSPLARGGYCERHHPDRWRDLLQLRDHADTPAAAGD